MIVKVKEHFRIGTDSWKCLVWALNVELRTRNSLLISFIVMNVEFCEIKTTD